MSKFGDIVSSYLRHGWREEFAQPYLFTFLVGLAMLLSAALRREKTALRSISFGGSDLYYFIPVLVWGIQATVHATNFMRSDFLVHATPAVPYVLAAEASSLVAGLGALALCLLAERAAAWRGLRRREGAPSLPLPILAEFCSIVLLWSFVVLSTQSLLGPA